VIEPELPSHSPRCAQALAGRADERDSRTAAASIPSAASVAQSIAPPPPERCSGVIVTSTDASWLPPGPVHDSVNVEFAVSGPTDSEPLVAREPVQAPDAVHDVAFVELQVNVRLPPACTLIADEPSTTPGTGGVAATLTPSVL
jgi:hypothetical protein